MPPIKRRHFLQFAGSTLATLGLSQFDLLHQANQYGRVLAQSTPRKLALLVGINHYPDPIISLEGCLTDVELQRELLVHRFGFNPQDILIVSDHEKLIPTRQNILEAFETHLIKQAKPGDVVVFHYSGHGSLIRDPNLTKPLLNPNGTAIATPNGQPGNGTIVPIDRNPTNKSNPDQVQDIMGRSLFLLMRALQTDNVTVVLDSCHSGGGTRGNLVIRETRPRMDEGDALPSPEEQEFQNRWLAKLKLPKATFEDLRRQGIAKGVALGSAIYDQSAADARFSGFTAGAFTYLLTRYLWQQTRSEAVVNVFTKLKLSTKDVANASNMEQEPVYAANPQSNSQEPMFFLTPQALPAEAVVRRVSDGQIEFWLGGVSSRSLEASDAGAIFALIDASGKELGEVEQTSRQGLVGVGKLRKGQLSDVQPGTLMWEQVREVPADLKLRLGLDPSLGDQKLPATTALQSVSRIAIVSPGKGVTVDYLLGRMTAEYHKRLQQQKFADLPAIASVGLFTAGLKPLPVTFARPQESVADAVERLRPRFKSLLAGRILQLAVGSDRGDRLKVAVSVVPKGANRAASAANYQFKSGTEFQVKVQNNESQNIYIAVLVISASGNLTVLYPYANTDDAALVEAGQSFFTPKADDGYQFNLKGSGFIEILTLASMQPLRDTLKAIQKIAAARGIGDRTATPLTRGDDSLDVVGALLGDLDRNTRSEKDAVGTGSNRAVNTKQLAAVSTLIEIVGG